MSSSRSNGQPNEQQVVDNYQPNDSDDQTNANNNQLPTTSSRQYDGINMMPTTSDNNTYSQPQPQPQKQQIQAQLISESNNDSDSNSNSNNINNTTSSSDTDVHPWGLSQDWSDSISRQLIEHMTQFGICVIDNFLGSDKGRAIFDEVEKLYSSRKYHKGSLVSDRFAHNNNSSTDPDAIRNDRVIWVNGNEQNCLEINNLIQTLSSVITNSSTLSLYSNNELDKIVINKRTKAHVSCYPGNGTRYVKHVDNPNCDGRLITAIYYLNENWNTKREGGLLRMYPTGSNQVANIEPLFDRALFFWSDRRNPHEVLPAYRDRYAITVWFIGDRRP